MNDVINLLNMHHHFFFCAKKYADLTKQPTPEDSRAWSQILVSLITGINGLGRRKGSDLSDGSDVKSANVWGAIDFPRFNGCIKSGTKSINSNSINFLNSTPNLYFVLWDYEPISQHERTRIWVVQPQYDRLFREISLEWYSKKESRLIRSANFQLHAPINKNSDVFTNQCGSLQYPLLFNAVWTGETYKIAYYNPDAITNGYCKNI